MPSTSYDEEHDVTVVLQDLPTTVRGFVCLGSDYNPCIVINARITKEQQMKTFRHELAHLQRGELYDPSYVEYT